MKRVTSAKVRANLQHYEYHCCISVLYAESRETPPVQNSKSCAACGSQLTVGAIHHESLPQVVQPRRLQNHLAPRGGANSNADDFITVPDLVASRALE
jgi:hypothetical protein